MSPIVTDPPVEKRKKGGLSPLGWLSENPETRSVQIAVIGTIIVHLLLLGVAPYLFKSEPPSHTVQRKTKSFTVHMAHPPPKPKVPPPPASHRYVETNPNAPTNKPDKTNNISNRDQQSAQEKASKVNNTDMPALDGKKDFKNDQIVDGSLSKPVEATPPSPLTETKPTPAMQKVQQAQQNPLSGTKKLVGDNPHGYGTDVAKPVDQQRAAPKKVEGTPNIPIIDGPQVTTPQVDAHHPRPRPVLTTQSRPAILADNPFGTRNVGVTGRDARWSHYGDYMNKLEETVQMTWDDLLSNERSRPPPGTSVQITFILTSTGDIKTFLSVIPSPGQTEMGSRACEAALRNPAPFGKWTDDMIAEFGTEQQLTFTFFYQ